MNEVAQEAMKQIDLKKYVNKFQRGHNKIDKVALIFSQRTNATVVIEEAKNWIARPLDNDLN
ncbi:MAG: hypothetical protein LBV23_09140 [Deltaproteobacteria bacterium]|jgi:hypothetical protein|nr:hypothetical protein [Deltaproteobacteria bacterium]